MADGVEDGPEGREMDNGGEVMRTLGGVTVLATGKCCEKYLGGKITGYGTCVIEGQEQGARDDTPVPGPTRIRDCMAITRGPTQTPAGLRWEVGNVKWAPSTGEQLLGSSLPHCCTAGVHTAGRLSSFLALLGIWVFRESLLVV